MKTIYHCCECKFTGHEPRITFKDERGDILCPNDCTYENGNAVTLLEYDPVDDSIPNAGVSERQVTLDAVHDYLIDLQLAPARALIAGMDAVMGVM